MLESCPANLGIEFVSVVGRETVPQLIDRSCRGQHNPPSLTHSRRLDLDAKLRQLLRDLHGALSKALADSSDVGRSMDRIREEGWSVYIVVDRKKEDEVPEAFELTTDRRRQGKASFRIDGKDLSFLRSIGIDPTRKARRRRK